MAKRTKIADILKYMQTHKKGITPAQARAKFHADRLADIVFKLRNRGHDIVTIRESSRDEYGVSQYARYVYVGEKSA